MSTLEDLQKSQTDGFIQVLKSLTKMEENLKKLIEEKSGRVTKEHDI